MASLPNYGLNDYIESHPLFNKKTKMGESFSGQLNPDRTKDQVRADLLKGHELLKTDLSKFEIMSPSARQSGHRDAEFVGYHFNQGVKDRANHPNRSFGSKEGHFEPETSGTTTKPDDDDDIAVPDFLK